MAIPYLTHGGESNFHLTFAPQAYSWPPNRLERPRGSAQAAPRKDQRQLLGNSSSVVVRLAQGLKVFPEVSDALVTGHEAKT